MRRSRLLPICGVALWALARGPERARSSEPGFREDVAPIVAKYCVDCHGPRKPKAGLNLGAYGDEAAVVRDRKAWEKVLENVEGGDMPPEGKPRPSREEADRLTQWLQATLSKSACTGPPDPGRVTMRRLNRSEYNNTIRDLVGVAIRPADEFPLDDVGYGFDNIGDVLTLSPILMERYLAAAEKVAEQAIVVGDGLDGPKQRREAESLEDSDGEPSGGGRLLATNGEVFAAFDFPKDGAYRLRVTAFGQQAGDEVAKMALRIDGETVETLDVAATASAPAVYEVRLPVHAGEHRVSAAFLNDYYNPDDPDEHNRDRNLWIDYLEVQGPMGPRNFPESHRRIFVRQPRDPGEWTECAREILERFVARAYRRPAAPGEVARLLKFVDQAAADGEPFERGIQLAVEAVLISPQFLYRVEADRPSDGPSQPLDDYELASRLSYFLWSSMPDEELFARAGAGDLHAPSILEAQARRMLKDPKAHALTEDFAGQWLQTRNLKYVTPAPKRFPQFDGALRRAMRTETEMFFEGVVREDRGVIDFLDANYTFLNARLARHYGIPGVEGDEFRRVELPDDRRGGLLTQASILTLTSNPTRTSPVKRGKWVLEQILGTPPPPPPPGVGELREDREARASGSLRRRMEQHRADPDCASCHSRMDPLGFGLENFDAIGAWREQDGKFPVDASGTLPSGQAFEGPGALKKLLSARAREFARCLAGKMLTYALGRGLDDEDRCVRDAIAEALAADGYRFSRLVVEVVRSEPFRMRGTRDRGGSR